MKNRVPENRVVSIPAARWLAYASAGAATALASASPAEAEIHYSGRVDTVFPPDENKSVKFPLDQLGDSISFAHTGFGGGWADFFGVHCPKSGAFVGAYGLGFEYAYVFRINKRHRNQYISQNPFSTAGFGAWGPWERWSGRGNQVRIGVGMAEALALSGFVSIMVLVTNTAGLASVRMGRIQTLVSQSSTMRGPIWESQSNLARPALLRTMS
jgi:hypothetical protein